MGSSPSNPIKLVVKISCCVGKDDDRKTKRDLLQSVPPSGVYGECERVEKDFTDGQTVVDAATNIYPTSSSEEKIQDTVI